MTAENSEIKNARTQRTKKQSKAEALILRTQEKFAYKLGNMLKKTRWASANLFKKALVRRQKREK